MEMVIEYRTCPCCGSERTADLLPPGEKVDTTLDLIYERGLDDGFEGAGLAAFRDPCFAICTRCAVIFVRVRSAPAAAARYYDRLFHVIETPLPYDTLPIPERFLDRKGRVARALVETLAEAGVLKGVESVLWVRCNAGEGPRALRDDHGLREVYALEVLPSLRRHATEVLGLERVAALPVPEFENPFERQRFDLIVCDEPFGHAHDPRRVAAVLTGLLAPGGSLVCFNEKDHSRILRSARLFPHGMNFFHKQLFTRRSLAAFLAECGFETKELPHPFLGKPGSLKNSKILMVARRSPSARPDPPTEEAEMLARTFRRWWRHHKWRRHGRRLRRALRRAPAEPKLGGAARS